MNILASFSGGRTSARMTYWLLNEWKDRHLHKIIVAFSNTGKEKEKSLEFVEMCDKAFGFNVTWVEVVVNPINGVGGGFRIVDFNTASRNGEPFEDVIKKHGIPNQSFPHCTRVLKAVPIRAFAKSIFGDEEYYTAIGIRKDEPKRLNWERAKKEKLIYPLAQYAPMTKSDIAFWWSKQSFDLDLKSYQGNCDLCWKKSENKLMTLLVENPEMAEWWQTMETRYENYTPESRTEKSKPPYRFYRGATTIQELVDGTKFPFKIAEDESRNFDKYKQLYAFDYSDYEDECSESCEVF